jgi:sugar lactone lactonase YvrE
MRKILTFLLIAAAFIFSSCSKENGYNIYSFSTNPANVTSLAGNGGQGNNNGTGTAAAFDNPSGLAVNAAGDIFVADFRNNVIREVTQAGLVTTFAGSGAKGSANASGVYSSFYQPTAVALDPFGNLYVADSGNNLIREISAAGLVTTLAGTGGQGFLDGSTSVATFNYPEGLAVDVSGNVYVADNGNNLIRKVTPDGSVMTVAGKVDSTGSINGADTASTFNEPTGVVLDAGGNVYIADFGNNMIRKISAAGGVTTFAGTGIAGFNNGAGASATFNGPTGIAIDASGNLYIADYGNNALRGISTAGVVTTLGAGTGGSFKKYSFVHPYGICLDSNGNIYVAVYGNNTIQKITNQ